MSRDRTRTRDGAGRDADDITTEFDIDAGEDDAAETTSSAETGGGLRSRVGSRAKRLFSPRHFAIALVASAGGLFAASAFVPLPGSGLLGVFVVAFLLGLVLDERRYAETTIAGGLAAGASTLFDIALVAVLGGFGVSVALLGGAVGAAAGLLGTYFGRDLRDGLTRDVP
jgi:hypothetical protein